VSESKTEQEEKGKSELFPREPLNPERELNKFLLAKYLATLEGKTEAEYVAASDGHTLKGVLAGAKHSEQNYFYRRENEKRARGEILEIPGKHKPSFLNAKGIAVLMLLAVVFGSFYIYQNNPQLVNITERYFSLYGLHILVAATLIMIVAVVVVARRRRKHEQG
jgi:hypothetical protein